MVWRFPHFRAKGHAEQSSSPDEARDDATTSAQEQNEHASQDMRSLDQSYALPANIQDMQRTHHADFQYYALHAVIGKNYLAPIEDPRDILHINCGMGAWCFDIAHTHPRARIYGLDLLDSRPVSTANVHFIAGNLLQPLPFSPNSFDFIRQERLTHILPTRQWQKLLRHIHSIARPDAWVEFIEGASEYCVPSGPANTQIADGLVQLSGQRGLDISLVNRLDGLLNPAQFTNIQKAQFLVPVGEWSGLLGSLIARDWQNYIYQRKEAFIGDLGYTSTQFDRITQTMREEWDTLHMSYPLNVIYAQVKK